MGRVQPDVGERQGNGCVHPQSNRVAARATAGARLADAARFIDVPHQEHLLELGILDWEQGFTTAHMNFPYESTSYHGWRLYPAYNHEFMLAPQSAENSVMFSFVSKNQAAIFLATNGELIVDDFRALCPADYYVEGY